MLNGGSRLKDVSILDMASRKFDLQRWVTDGKRVMISGVSMDGRGFGRRSYTEGLGLRAVLGVGMSIG